jgi:glycosyltransferase involved in cell wall biosynthesis
MKRQLYLVQSTDATIDSFKKVGLWERQKHLLESYAEKFQVFYYTSDWESYQTEMPNDVIHRHPFVSSHRFGLRHVCFYTYLSISAFFWKKGNVIRVFGVTLPILSVLKILSGNPIVVSYQYDWAEQTRANYGNIKRYLSRIVEKIALNSADRILYTVPWLGKKLVEYYGLEVEKCILQPNFVDINLFYPQKKKNIVMYAGRLHWSKGVQSLIFAFIEASKQLGGYKLYILGDGEEHLKLKKAAAGEVNIIFMGSKSHSEVARLMREAEIFVLPTLTMEGHPKALIEAMAAGCICLASDVAGNYAIMKEAKVEENLFPASNVKMLSERLIQASRQDNSQLTSDFAKMNYASEQIIAKEIDLLLTLCN